MLDTPQIQYTLFEFDYSTLPDSERNTVQYNTLEIKKLAKRSAENIIIIGKLLTETKLVLGHGKFGKWLEAEFSWTQKQAIRFMNVFAKFDIMSNMDNYAPTALYLLSEPSTPDSALERASVLANDGEYISAKRAKEIISDCRPDRGLYSSDSDEWYTPNDITYRVLLTLGQIDLDPCSNSKTDPNIPATKHYTIEDDGLTQDWSGKVYMNPPYGRVIADWVARMVEDYQTGMIDESILLVPSRTDTAWFRLLRDYPHCFIWGRLKFSENGTPAPFPSMAVYLGKDTNKFYDAFRDIGDVYVRFQRSA